MLDEEPKPDLGIIPWNKWLASKEEYRRWKTKKYYTKVFEEEEEEETISSNNPSFINVLPSSGCF